MIMALRFWRILEADLGAILFGTCSTLYLARARARARARAADGRLPSPRKAGALEPPLQLS